MIGGWIPGNSQVFQYTKEEYSRIYVDVLRMPLKLSINFLDFMTQSRQTKPSKPNLNKHSLT